MSEPVSLPRYDIGQTYDWNYVHAPQEPPSIDVPECPGEWDFCGIRVSSPLGVPAGPLLNSQWILYYAALGFDVLTYKTVRSNHRACFELPNLLPVAAGALDQEGQTLQPHLGNTAVDSWAISFGMPSKHPDVWRADIETARRGLGKGQVLVVSVVASPQAGWSIDDVARDFAQCARWAAESGAHVVEPNLSCPNVCTQEADLYLSGEASGRIAGAVRDAVPHLPIVLKVGLFSTRAQAEALVQSVSPYVNAISATNSITAKVEGMFGGLRRGIGGAAITQRCTEEIQMLSEVIIEQNSGLSLIGVGGISNCADVRARLDAGAHHVQIATAAMIDPAVAIAIRREGW